MKYRMIFLVAAVLLLGGAVFWFFFRDSEEAKIRHTLRQLCILAEKSATESVARGALKISRTDEVFAPVCRFDFKYEIFTGSLTPREITSNLARYRMFFRWSDVSMRDLHVIDISGDHASAVFTGTLNGVTTEGKRVDEVRDLFCKLVKIEGAWRIDELSVHEVLEK